MFVSLARLCVVYIVKQVPSFSDVSQLMGIVRKRIHASVTDQQEDSERI